MTLRHMFRSAELITLVSRLGHGENYSFCVELETALATMVQQSSNLLTSQIIRNPSGQSLFHSDFDNFDKFTASGSVHTAHGIMLQETDVCETSEDPCTAPDVPTLPRTKKRSLDISFDASEMPECYVTQRKSPTYDISTRTCPTGEDATKAADVSNMLWVFCRWVSSSSVQEVPGWSGVVSLTGVAPASTTTIDYYPVINAPITDYKTVQQCLQYSESATREVGQEYVVTSFDLGVCMKAYPLVWNNPIRYEKHIIMIGSFHVVCAYLKMLGKKMNGTGLDDIFVEAGLITSGSVNGVMSGKNYSRSMVCHKAMLEGLERLLLSEFLKSRNSTDLLALDEESVMKDLLEMPSQSNLEAATLDGSAKTLVRDYMAFKESVRQGGLGKTAQLWLSYMDHVWLVLSLIKAVKSNDYSLYCHCYFKMADLFFSFDGQNYSRYLTYFSVFLANVDKTHPGARDLLERGAFSVARSFIPGNRCPVDKTIEETFMKHSKSHGGAGGCGAGLTGLVTDYKAYQRWVKTNHERTQFVEVMLSMAEMLSESRSGRKHKDLRPAEVKKSEKMTKRTVEAITSFLNPFDLADKSKLYCLSSGAPASAAIESDVMSAEQKGKEAKNTFITERLEKKDHFFEPIKRTNLKTMGDNKKAIRMTTTKNKVIEYRQQGNIMLHLLMKSQEGGKVDIQELMAFPLTPVPYSLATADGYLNKTDKARGFHYLNKDVENAALPNLATCLTIEDGNAVFYYLREIPGNFHQICKKVFEIMVKSSDVVFSTDQYFPDSVKSVERHRRGCREKLIVQGPMTKRPADWKLFLTNGANKVQLIKLLLRVWSQDDFNHEYQDRKVILVSEGRAHSLETDGHAHTKVQEIQSLSSNHEETDSRVVLYCKYACDQGYESVRVRSPDSDVFFVLLHHTPSFSCTVLFDTGTGNNKRLINMTELVVDFTQEYCTALTALHAFTHCDSTSAFKGIGKVKPVKVLQKNPRFQRVLARLGEDWNAADDVLAGLEAFTCAMYGRNRLTSVNELRYTLIKEKCEWKDGKFNTKRNVDLCSLPPCQRALIQHIHRANYQMAIWRRADTAMMEVPLATDGHGWTMDDGIITPLWYEGSCLPNILVDEDLADLGSDDEDEVDEDELSIYESESDED